MGWNKGLKKGGWVGLALTGPKRPKKWWQKEVGSMSISSTAEAWCGVRVDKRLTLKEAFSVLCLIGFVWHAKKIMVLAHGKFVSHA